MHPHIPCFLVLYVSLRSSALVFHHLCSYYLYKKTYIYVCINMCVYVYMCGFTYSYFIILKTQSLIDRLSLWTLYVAEAGSELPILLLLPPERSDYRPEPPYLNDSLLR